MFSRKVLINKYYDTFTRYNECDGDANIEKSLSKTVPQVLEH